MKKKSCTVSLLRLIHRRDMFTTSPFQKQFIEKWVHFRAAHLSSSTLEQQ